MNRESSWNVYEFSVFILNDWIKNEILLENEESTETGSDSHEKKIIVNEIKGETSTWGEGITNLRALEENQIKSFIKIVKDYKKLCGLSGSLKIKDIDYLKDLNPHFLGFRGQLCDKASERIELNIDLLNKVSKEIKSIINA